MRRYYHSLVFTGLLAGMAACSSGERDSVADAKFQNEERIGNENVTRRQEQDAEFLVDVASSSLLAMELGKVAQQKATNPSVRAFGQQLAREQAAINGALRTLASQKELALPDALGGREEDLYRKLVGFTGAEFDRELVEAVADYDDSADAFEDMADDAYDGDIRAFAAKHAPTVKAHAERAAELHDQLKP